MIIAEIIKSCTSAMNGSTNDKKDGGSLWEHLRCRKKRYGSYEKRGQIPNRTFIDERPKIAADRNRLGDWETDTIIGKGR